MANYSKVILAGRLTRDPEERSFPWGKVVSFGMAVNNRKKDANGQWVDDPAFIDLKAFDRESGRKLATVVGSYCKKGHQVFVDGHLVQETWEDRNGGGKRSKLVVVCDDIQLLEKRQEEQAATVPQGKPKQESMLSYQDSPF